MAQMKPRHISASGASFDPSLYPRTYSMSRWNQRPMIVAGLVIAVVLPTQLWRSGHLTTQPELFIAMLYVLAGGFLVLRAFTLKVILEPDAITVRGIFSRRRLLRGEIAGWSVGGRGRMIVVLRNEDHKTISFPAMNADREFFAWFAGIPQAKPVEIIDTPPGDSIVTQFLTWLGIMAGILTILLLFVFLNHKPFEAQIVFAVADTEFIFFLVFF